MRCCANRPNTWMHPTKVLTAEKLLRRGGRPHMTAVRHDLGQRYRDGLPDPGFAPSPETAIDGVPTAVFRRNVSPRRSAPEPPKYAVDDRAVLFGPSTSPPVLRFDWQQAFQNALFRFGEIAPAQTYLQMAALNQFLPMASIQHCSKSAFVIASA